LTILIYKPTNIKMVMLKRWNEEELLANHKVKLSFTMYNIVSFDQLPIQILQGLIMKPQPIILHSKMAFTTHQKTFLIQLFKISHPWCACNLVERVKYLDKHFISCVMKLLKTICDQICITIKVQCGLNNVFL
jgi:hypothetical protein